MSNNIAVDVTVNVADLQVKRAIMSAELKTATKDLNDFAREAQKSGNTEALRAGMLSAADNVSKLRAQIRQVDSELKTFSSNAGHHGGATAMSFNVMGQAMTLNRAQMMETTHVARSLFDTLAAGGNPLRALTLESGRVAQIMGEGAGGMAGSMAALTGIVPALIGAAGFVGLAAALAYVAVQAHEGAEKQLEMRNALVAVGDAVGVTESQLYSMGDSIAKSLGRSPIEVRNLELEVVKLGRVTGDNVGTMVADAELLGTAFGEKPAEALRQIQGLSNNVTESSAKLNEQLHFLTEEQWQNIKALEEEGNRAGALGYALDALRTHLQGVSQDAGWLDSVFRSLKNSTDAFISSMQSLGREPGPAEELANLQNLLSDKAAQAAIVAHGGSVDTDQIKARIKSLQQVADLQKTMAAWVEQNHRDEELAIQDDEKYGKKTSELAAAQQARQRITDGLAAAEKQLGTATTDAARAAAQSAVSYKQSQLKEVDADIERIQRRIDGPKGPKEKKAKGPGAADFENELKQAEFKIKNDSQNWLQDMRPFELKFWQQKLDAAKVGTKQYEEVYAKFLDARTAVGERDAQNKQRMDEGDIQTTLDVQKSGIGGQRSNVEDQFQAGIISAQQKRLLMGQLLDLEVKDEIDAQEAKKALYANDVVAVHAATDEEKRLYATLDQQVAQLDKQLTEDKKRELDRQIEAERQAAEERKKLAKEAAQSWRTANDLVLSSEQELAADILERRQNLGQEIATLALKAGEKELLADIKYFSERKLLQAEGLAADEATSKGGLLVQLFTQRQQVKANAGTAASGAYAALASIPIVGPALGAAAAGTVYAAASAFGGFEKGLDVVPRDMIAQIHQGERIVPRADNTAIMNAISGGGPGAGAQRAGPSRISFGDVNFHGTGRISAEDVENMFNDHRHMISKHIDKLLRKGVR